MTALSHMISRIKNCLKFPGKAVVIFASIVIAIIISLVLLDIYHNYKNDGNIIYSSYITPLITCISFTVAFLALSHNHKSSKEKNSLEVMAKFNGKENYEICCDIYKLRSQHLIEGTSKLDRKKISSTIEMLADLRRVSYQDKISEDEKQRLESEIICLKHELVLLNELNFGSNDLSKSSEKVKKDILAKQKRLAAGEKFSENYKLITGMVKVLNDIEEIACGIRYGVYDENLLFSTCASQIIDIYEIAYIYIKKRQVKNDRLLLNAEWLAVKWTLQREVNEAINNVSAQKRAIQHANEALKLHLKAPDEKKIHKALKKVIKLSNFTP